MVTDVVVDRGQGAVRSRSGTDHCRVVDARH